MPSDRLVCGRCEGGVAPPHQPPRGECPPPPPAPPGCMMMRMVADGFVLNSSSLGATGIEEMRWLAPVRPGDRLSVRVTVLETTESKRRPERGFVRARFEVFTATGICVLTAVANLIFGRRLGAAPARAAQAIEQP